MKQKRDISDETYIELHQRLKTLSKIAVELKVPEVTVWRRCKKLGLEFNSGKDGRGKKIELSEILEGKHPHFQTLKLKKRIIKEKVLPYKCVECGLSEWRDKELSLHLDHIDGDSKNHKLENLRLLCPNCHSQTDTWCGKNK